MATYELTHIEQTCRYGQMIVTVAGDTLEDLRDGRAEARRRLAEYEPGSRNAEQVETEIAAYDVLIDQIVRDYYGEGYDALKLLRVNMETIDVG